jgi:hypothetical protein
MSLITYNYNFEENKNWTKKVEQAKEQRSLLKQA